MFTATLNEKQKEYLQKQLERDQALRDAIKARLQDLEQLALLFSGDYEDGIYRLYHHSFKVYNLQGLTLRAVDLFDSVGQAINAPLCDWYKQIVAEGTGKEWRAEHNREWLFHTRPIVEAFLHTKYFLDMMVKYSRELDSPSTILPFGWGAILELYNQG